MTSVMLIILAVWFVALFSGAPIYVLMALAGAAFAYVAGIDLIVIPQKFTKAAESFPLVAVLVAITFVPALTTSLPNYFR